MTQVPEMPLEDVHLLANHNFLRLGEFFDLDKREDRLDNKQALEEILDWGKKKSNSEDIIDVLLHIRQIERGLIGNSGESRVTKLRRYIALEKDQEKIDKEMSLIKGGSIESQK